MCNVGSNIVHELRATYLYKSPTRNFIKEFKRGRIVQPTLLPTLEIASN